MIVTRDESITKWLDPDAATVNRDALAKIVYSRLFDWYAVIHFMLAHMRHSLPFYCRMVKRCLMSLTLVSQDREHDKQLYWSRS